MDMDADTQALALSRGGLAFLPHSVLAGRAGMLGAALAHAVCGAWLGGGSCVSAAASADEWFCSGFQLWLQRQLTTAVHGREYTAMECRLGRLR